jgi:hypothetical protein
MFLGHRPSALEVEAFIAASRQLPLSYAPIGLAGQDRAGFQIDEQEVVIGLGQAAFDRAKVALTKWRHFELGWVKVGRDLQGLTPPRHWRGIVCDLRRLEAARLIGQTRLSCDTFAPRPFPSRFGRGYGTRGGRLTAAAPVGGFGKGGATGIVILPPQVSRRPLASRKRPWNFSKTTRSANGPKTVAFSRRATQPASDETRNSNSD